MLSGPFNNLCTVTSDNESLVAKLPNICTRALEKRYLDGCPSKSKSVVYRRYVGDTFCLFSKEEDADLFLNYINTFHNTINSTVEKENDNSLPFLDVPICKNDAPFSISLFRKHIFTGLYTDFSILSPHKYKINLNSALVSRAFNICSSYVNFHRELIKIKHIILSNRYPSSKTDSFIRNFLDKRSGPLKQPPNSRINCLLSIGFRT